MTAASRASNSGAPALALDDEAVEAQGRRAAQVENTRRTLLDVARELFTQNGYQATRTEEVVQRAGVTRGALYHHFRDKEDLFRAVFAEVEDEVSALLQRRSADVSTSSWDLFRANSEVHLSAAAVNPSYRQIVMVDGPAVMGWTEWNERLSGLQGSISEYLRGAIEEGSIDDQPLEPLSQMLLSIGHGSAMYIAQAADPEAAHAQIEELAERLLEGLSRDSRDKTRESKPTKKTTKKENH